MQGGTSADKEVDDSQSCRYCGISRPECLVQCSAPNCQKWFCNSSEATSGSHIINHLVRSKHKEITLHGDSSLGECTLECWGCGTRNVFLLGFIPAVQQSVVVLLCRQPCLGNIGSMKELALDPEQWKPLIQNRAFLEFLVEKPSAEELGNALTVTAQRISKLEEVWKVHPDAVLQNMEDPSIEDTYSHVQPTYVNAFEYARVFAPLVKLEAQYDRAVKEAQHQTDVSVRWALGMNKRRLAYFFFLKDNNENRLVIGDELRLRYKYKDGRTWKMDGHVSRLTQTEEVCLELRCGHNTLGPWSDNITDGFIVEFVWKAISFERMIEAMKVLANDEKTVSAYLFHQLMGHEAVATKIESKIPSRMSAPNLAELNESQIEAVKHALTTPLCLIQGPPGTGKTVTSATIIYHLVQNSKEQVDGKRLGPQVLVTAPSNVAVDQLAEQMRKTGLKVVRVYAKSRESVSSTIEQLALHRRIEELADSATEGPYAEFKQLMAAKQITGELKRSDEKRLLKLRRSAEKVILESADVVCSTCVSSGDVRLAKMRFPMVLIDEATQATEPESLIPIVKGARQLILVGDHCQLGPVIMCKTAAKAGLSQSIFERLICNGTRPRRLEVQYRMHPALAAFPSGSFYEGTLQNGVTHAQREYSDNVASLPFPNPTAPMFFYHSVATEEISASGTSYLNRSEAINVEKIVTMLLKAGIGSKQIGVITPYDGQRAYITQLISRQTSLKHSAYADIEIASVDAFQGREKDFIILSCVRSNDNIGIGFLQDARRLNVALTRARYGLIICGNAKVLSQKFHRTQSVIWVELLRHYMKIGNLVVDGPLNNLKPVSLNLHAASRQPGR